MTNDDLRPILHSDTLSFGAPVLSGFVEVCEHALWGTIPWGVDGYEITDFTYCPKCGEKL